jgi:radical SAM-linked protein
MQANYVQRLRLTFSKMGPARYIGHLDLSRTLERSFNRGRIPIAYTQGFNRRPRMSLAAALPLGLTSEHELADVWLAEEMEPAHAQEVMMRKMAPGIVISAVQTVPLSAPSLQSTLRSASYEAKLPASMDEGELEKRLAKIVAAESLSTERRRGRGKVKEYDLRPLILDLRIKERGVIPLTVTMKLSLTPNKSGRPDDVVAVLGVDPHQALIHRTMITLFE